MAAKRKPAAKKIKFELTRSGIAGIGVVVFCIFLWMFLLGVWTGQSLLVHSFHPEKSLARQTAAGQQVVVKPLVIEAGVNKKLKKTN